MRKQPVAMAAYFKETAGAFDSLLRHLSSYSIAEILINIAGAGMASEDPLLPLEFLEERRFVHEIATMLGPAHQVTPLVIDYNRYEY